MIHRHELDLSGRSFSVETGRLAKQADGAVVVRYGDSVVLVAVVGAKEARPGFDFLPLTVDYREMTFAQGKIPGGFFKREGRPTEKEILTMRMTDRPIRPLFPEGYRCEIQVFATVISADKENDPDLLAVFGASAALGLSGIPFAGPIAAVRIGRVDGELIVNPTYDQLAKSDLNLTVAGGRDGLNMVEGGAQEIEESVLLDALFLAQDTINPLLDMQDKLKADAGKPTRDFTPPVRDAAIAAKVAAVATPGMTTASQTLEKQARYEAYSAVKTETLEALAGEFPDREGEIKDAVGALKKSIVRKRTAKEQIRIDGRGPTDIRAIESEVGFLPRVHGSTMFQRGETQALVTATLGSTRDTQRIEAFGGETTRNFMLHYKFPSYCVGEVRPIRGPSRREIGHGALAERALKAVMPNLEDFPYTVRIFSEITESNGSSSMASVCGGCMSMMDAGVPLKAAVAGIAMGLIKEGGDFAILSDILGDEDHLGDMDFKVAGTAKGITAVQMDIKCDGVTRDIMSRALEQAKAGRMHILKKMAETLREPRTEISAYAPRITTIQIPVERIKDIIGPGGRIIRKIQDDTGSVLEIENDGRVRIFAADQVACQAAIDAIKACTEEPEVGRIYPGIVKKVMDFGAFVEILPGVDGLVHISQLAEERVQSTSDVCKEGDEFPVKVLEIDRSGKIRLSRKEAMADAAKADAAKAG